MNFYFFKDKLVILPPTGTFQLTTLNVLKVYLKGTIQTHILYMLSYSKSFIKVLTKGFTFVKYTVHQMKNYVNLLTSLPNPLPLPSTKFFPSNTSIILSFILFLPSFLPFYFQFLFTSLFCTLLPFFFLFIYSFNPSPPHIPLLHSLSTHPNSVISTERMTFIIHLNLYRISICVYGSQ